MPMTRGGTDKARSAEGCAELRGLVEARELVLPASTILEAAADDSAGLVTQSSGEVAVPFCGLEALRVRHVRYGEQRFRLELLFPREDLERVEVLVTATFGEGERAVISGAQVSPAGGERRTLPAPEMPGMHGWYFTRSWIVPSGAGKRFLVVVRTGTSEDDRAEAQRSSYCSLSVLSTESFVLSRQGEERSSQQ